MKRMACAALLASVAVAALGIRALAKEDVSGNWTVNMFDGGRQITYWLVHLEEKGGKLEASVESAKGVPQSTVSDVRVKDGMLAFTVSVRSITFDFQGKMPKGEAKKIRGSMARGGQMIPAILERTDAKDLKDAKTIKDFAPKLPKELDLKFLTDLGDNPIVFDLAAAMLRKAAANKATPEQVRSWYDLVAKEAPAYGPRWQHEVGLRIAEVLAAQKPYATIAEQAARQAVSGAKSEMQLRAMTALVTALRNEGSPDYAKEAATLEKMERSAYHAHENELGPFKAEKSAGRKGKSERTVLVELFTGAMCPPCVAADLAFDGLAKAYSTKDVVLLQYHEHIPGPDPLTNDDSEARLRYYGNEVEGTPTIFFDGKSAAGGGGGKDDAKNKFEEYQKVIDPLLEKPASVKIQADAIRTGDKIRITTNVSGVEKPGEKVRLRLVLVEDWARYGGGNGLTYHHHVVRDMPGGAEGRALTKEADKQEVTVDLNQLRSRLGNYLEGFAKKAGRPFNSSWPLSLYDLRVVAFVQNDENKEVLQAVEIPIRSEGQK